MKQGLQDNIVLDLGNNGFDDVSFNTWGGKILDKKLNECSKAGTIFDVVIKGKGGNRIYTAPILSWKTEVVDSNTSVYATIKGPNVPQYITKDITVG